MLGNVKGRLKQAIQTRYTFQADLQYKFH